MRWTNPKLFGKAFIGAPSLIKGNPLYKVDGNLKNIHYLDEYFSNQNILEHFVLFDLWYIMRNYGDSNIGHCCSKNIKKSITVFYDPDKKSVSIWTNKFYKNQKENVHVDICKRFEWFLNQNVFIESFTKHCENSDRVTFEIVFKECYTEIRKKRLEEIRVRKEIQEIKKTIETVNWAIDNYKSLSDFYSQKQNLNQKLSQLRESQKHV